MKGGGYCVCGRFCGVVMIMLAAFAGWGSGNAWAAGAQEQIEASSSEYLIGIGDVLEVSVWNEPEISKTVFVRLDGKISLPLIGDVPAQGASPELLSRQISTAMSKLVADPSVTVTIKDSYSRIYYVVGQIAKPGEYRLNTPVSILQAIARAGGFAEWAKKGKIMIVRRSDGRDRIINFDYDKFINDNIRDNNVNVMPGDTIVVP